MSNKELIERLKGNDVILVLSIRAQAADALAAADKRIAELESSWAACHAQLAESCDERYKLERKLAVAREALEKYGRHDKNCEAVTEAVSECCGCGLDESLAQIGGGDE